jgi:hypothetical protein
MMAIPALLPGRCDGPNPQGIFMFRKSIQALALSLLCVNPLFAQSQNEGPEQTGELIWRDPSCFFFVLKIEEKYSLFEFLGGPSPMVGNTFEGKLSSFGTRKIENKTEGKPTMVYSETFGLTKSLMDKKIPRQCKRKKNSRPSPDSGARIAALGSDAGARHGSGNAGCPCRPGHGDLEKLRLRLLRSANEGRLRVI